MSNLLTDAERTKLGIITAQVNWAKQYYSNHDMLAIEVVDRDYTEKLDFLLSLLRKAL